MIMGLTCSMTLTMAPVPVIAAAGEPQTQAASGERQSESGKSGEGETKQDDTQKTAEKKKSQKKDKTKAKESQTDSEKNSRQQNDSTDSQKENDENDTKEKVAKASDLIIGGLTLKCEEDLTSGVDYTYSESTKILSIKSDKKILIDGNSSLSNTKLVLESDANITLSDVRIKTEDGIALNLNGKKLSLTLNGSNSFVTDFDDTSAVNIPNEAELTIAGSGKLTVSGKGTGKDITLGMKSGKLKIESGTVVAKSGIVLKATTSTTVGAQVSVTGGSVNLGAISPANKLEIKGKDNVNVYPATIVVDSGSTEITDLAVKKDGTTFSYGNTGVFSDEDKKIYLYLPRGQMEVTASKLVYSGEVKESGSNILVNKQTEKVELRAADISFSSATYGSPADAKAITITNPSESSVKFDIQLSGSDADSFVLTKPTDSSSFIVSGRTGGKDGINESFKVQPAKKATAGTHMATIKVSYGDNLFFESKVSCTVEKANLTPVVELDEKKYDGSQDGSGKVIFEGAVEGDTPKEKLLEITYNSANVAEADKVEIKVTLDEATSVNYKLTKDSWEETDNVKILKADYEKSPKKPSVSEITYSSFQYKALKGQQYCIKSGTSKPKESEWKNDTRTTTGTIKASGATENTTYTVWTRYGEDENHNAGTKLTSTKVKTLDKPDQVTSTDNKITGIVEGTTYKNGSTLSFKAIGAGMDNTSPNEGDERYLPTSWKVTEEHSFVSGKYEASFTINTTGSHTLQVTFKKQKYEGSSWVDVNMTSYKKVSFKTATSGVNGTGSGTNGSGTNGSGTNGSGSGKNNTAAKTADNAPILPLGVVFAGSGLLLAGYTLKRRRRA